MTALHAHLLSRQPPSLPLPQHLLLLLPPHSVLSVGIHSSALSERFAAPTSSIPVPTLWTSAQNKARSGPFNGRLLAYNYNRHRGILWRYLLLVWVIT